jgi:hypothetical protein
VFGKQDNTNAIELSAIAAGTGGFIINGESANDYIVAIRIPSCESVSVFFSLMASTTFATSSAAKVPEVFDVNGDGLDDLIVGAYANDQSNKSLAGRSYVVFGKQNNTDAINLSAIAAGTGGFVINGESASDRSGYSVSSAGDVNGDGLDDLIVGAYSVDSSC